jgi:hypothetical protein
VLHSRGTNTDGLHFNGPANDITIANCDFQTDDDSIALNCPEGYSGDIARVLVTNCTFDSWSLMRLYTANAGPKKFVIDSISVKNCTGTLAETAFYLGLGYSSSPDSISSLTVSDCNLTGPAVLGVSENFGNIKLQNVVYTPKPSRIEPKRYPFCALLRPAPYITEASVRGSSLSLENCTIHLDSDTRLAAAVIENGSSIATLRLNGFAVVDRPGKPPLPALLEIGSGSIGQLVVDSVTSNNIGAPATAAGFARIGMVCGTGVLASEWEFPDAVMADNVPYISAASGVPSIKVNGVVQRYTGP